MPSLRRTAVVTGLLVLATVSCSSEQEPPAATPGGAAPSPGATAAATPSATAAATPSASPLPSSDPSPAEATMTISGFAYSVPESVAPGAPVTVVNQDREAHTVTVDRGAVRLTVLPGETAVFRAPSQAGPHAITCDLHGGMDAVLVVA